jgi:hypothetical protein
VLYLEGVVPVGHPGVFLGGLVQELAGQVVRLCSTTRVNRPEGRRQTKYTDRGLGHRVGGFRSFAEGGGWTHLVLQDLVRGEGALEVPGQHFHERRGACTSGNGPT